MKAVAYAACVVAIYAICLTGAAFCWCGGQAMRIRDRLRARS